MPEPEIVDASSQPSATGIQQPSYKSLLNQQVQKLYKQLPVFQSKNEGSGHQPKFRTTVWVDGVSYTSPNTFQHRKLAEADASKVALFAIMHKLKTEASRYVLEDKSFCKSILGEYGARMNIQRPTYQTIQTGSVIPFFRSSLVFDDVTYTGDDCRTKKEAEQSAARAVVLKYLDSESGNILSEIIKSKINYLTVTKDIQSVENDNNGVNGLTLIEAKGDQMTKTPSTSASPETLLVQHTNTPPPVDLTQKNIQEISTTQALTQTTTAVPTALSPTQLPTQPLTQTIPATNIPQIPTQTISVPTVLAQTPLTDNAASMSMPATLPTCNVVQPINTDPASVTTTPPLPTSGKKRNRKNRKNGQKRMRTENQLALSAMFHGQVPTFSVQ